MIFRAATGTDASSLAALSIEVWVGTYLKQGVSGSFADYVLEEFTPAKMAALINDPAQRMIVAEAAGGIVGFIRLSAGATAPIGGCSDTEIATLYVQPRHQGKGIGKQLLARGCAQVGESPWLTTNAENDNAIAFYLNEGFQQVGETHFRIGDEGYLNNVYVRGTP